MLTYRNMDVRAARRRLRCAVFALAFSYGLGALPAAAQPAADRAPLPARPNPAEADKDRARAAVVQGDALSADKRLAEALVQYQLADGIMGVPFTRMKVASAQAELGQLVKARETARSVAGIAIRPDEPPAFLKARADAQQLINELSSRIAIITFTIEPAAAVLNEAAVDGQALTAAVLRQPFDLDPGKHVVTAKAPGFKPLEHTVEIREGQRSTVTLRLEPLGNSSTPLPRSNPSGSEPADRSEGGGLAPISPVAWIGFGFAGAGLIAGAVTGGLAAGRAGQLKDLCIDNQCQPEQHADLDSANTLAHVSTASFAVAGVGAVVGLIGLLVLSPTSSGTDGDTAVRVVPYVSPTAAGILGSF